MAFGQKPHLLLDHPESAVERPRRCAFKRSRYRRVIIVGCGLAATGMFTPHQECPCIIFQATNVSLRQNGWFLWRHRGPVARR